MRRCEGCGAELQGGTAACRALYDEVLARDYSEPAYFACHKLVVDAYSLQHPDRFCRSAKSLASHLVGLCEVMEHEGAIDRGSPALKQWLDGTVDLAKPHLPERRGEVTLPNLPLAADPSAWRAEVRRWAQAVWRAYEPLHATAREWRAAAAAARRQ